MCCKLTRMICTGEGRLLLLLLLLLPVYHHSYCSYYQSTTTLTAPTSTPTALLRVWLTSLQQGISSSLHHMMEEQEPETGIQWEDSDTEEAQDSKAQAGGAGGATAATGSKARGGGRRGGSRNAGQLLKVILLLLLLLLLQCYQSSMISLRTISEILLVQQSSMFSGELELNEDHFTYFWSTFPMLSYFYLFVFFS